MSQERLFSPSKPTTSDACIVPRSVSISVRLAYTCVLFVQHILEVRLAIWYLILVRLLKYTQLYYVPRI